MLAGLLPGVRSRAELALSWAKYYRLDVTVTSGLRTESEQSVLRARFEGCLARGEKVYPGNPNSECRYPANRPGDSAHNFGMAFDSSVPSNQLWAWNYLREYAGFRLDPDDPPHAEVPNWRTYVKR